MVYQHYRCVGRVFDAVHVGLGFVLSSHAITSCHLVQCELMSTSIEMSVRSTWLCPCCLTPGLCTGQFF